MVSFCNRSTVFLPISGHRYRTEFRFKISTGEPDAGGRGWGRSQGKIAEAKARPPSSKPRVIQRPYSPMAYAGAAGLRRRVARVSVPPGGHMSNIYSITIHALIQAQGHPAPILRVCHPAQGSERRRAHTHHIRTPLKDITATILCQLSSNNRQQQSWPTQSNNAGTCYLNSFRQHVLTETNHTDMPT